MTGSGDRGRIRPGQFVDFPISVQVPGKEGDKLTFKANQTYSNGEVVRWIGAPDADDPAPQVTVLAAASEEEASGAAQETATPVAAAADDGTDTMSIVALVLGGLALLVAIAAFARGRRQPA